MPHPVREEGPSFVPPTGVSSEVVGDIDRIKRISQGAKVWIEGIQEVAFKHAKELVQVHNRALVALSTIQCMEESWVDEHIYQEEVIADIQNLMETPKQELIDGQVISEGDVYDFI